jgi:hypothetical protein
MIQLGRPLVLKSLCSARQCLADAAFTCGLCPVAPEHCLCESAAVKVFVLCVTLLHLAERST